LGQRRIDLTASLTIPKKADVLKRVGAIMAAIDVGSNATRLRIFRVASAGAGLEEIARHRFGVQLGAGAFESGRLGEAQINAVVQALREAGKMADKARAEAVVAVATSAVREAGNGAEFVARVKAAAGIDVCIIGGAEEANLAALGAVGFVAGVSARQTGSPQPASGGASGGFVIDIGGGSTELAQTDGAGNLLSHASLPLGAVRYADAWGRSAFSDDQLCRYRAQIRRAVASGVDALLVSLHSRDGESTELAQTPAAYALGGTPAALADMRAVLSGGLRAVASGASTGDTNLEISRDEVENLFKIISRATLEELCERYGVREARAGLLLPGALILSAVMDVLHIPSILPTDRGICEGLAMRWLRDLERRP
jgi:exopolyphosphatase/guanosine-5'-triphosphate,3'-diphosphate pyrophosphatase